MREIKQIFHTKEERAKGLEVLQKFQRQSARLQSDYYEFHSKLFKEFQTTKMTWEEYMIRRKPVWDKYRADEDAIYKTYLAEAKELLYDVGDE